MKTSLSCKHQAKVAIAGHVGCGHCHSHKQFVQDDSVGLAVVLTLFQEATGLSLNIKDIRTMTGLHGYIEVETESGGIGRATARRGITVHEALLAKTLIGNQDVRTHTLTMEAFGRFYGQGIHEAPVALQTALANAALDSFVKNFPDQFVWGYEDVIGSCGLMAGTILDIDGIPTAVLGTVNASSGGIGPNEDLEGNAAIGIKGELMTKLGMTELPTIVIEGKVYWPALSDVIDEPTFLVRGDEIDDNPIVAQSIFSAAQELGHKVTLNMETLKRMPGNMAKQTQELGAKIAALGEKLKTVEYAQEKVNILADLASLVSQDGAGVSFMSNKLHEIIGGIGMIPGTGAVLSSVIPRQYHEDFVVPFATQDDVNNYVAITKKSVRQIYQVLPQALEHAKAHAYKNSLDSFVLKGR
ncbi:hypothetical protein SDC9_13690 [bioreactor metagenome]|uniref:Uncharacterized protein n=1 Tax=bioreactor metagenome TaxID=1076179 RepID=A0A644TLZ7_9ZZZZ